MNTCGWGCLGHRVSGPGVLSVLRALGPCSPPDLPAPPADIAASALLSFQCSPAPTSHSAEQQLQPALGGGVKYRVGNAAWLKAPKHWFKFLGSLLGKKPA